MLWEYGYADPTRRNAWNNRSWQLFTPVHTTKAHAAKGKYIAAICAAPSILGRLEILSGKKATSYPGFEQDMIGCEYLTQPTVVDGNIITSRGLGTAISFAGEIITLLTDKETADNVKADIIC